MDLNNTKLLIFDWDGTLMDSVMHIVASMRHAISDLGLEPRLEEEMRNVIGLGMHEAINMLYPQQMNSDFANAFTSAYRRYFFIDDAPQQLFTGAHETLRYLDQQGYQLAVATGKSRRGLDQVLAETGVNDLFCATRCADETRSKPDPLMLKELLVCLDIEPHHALMIGDTEYDMEMASNAGVPALGVSYGVHTHQRLQQHDPLHVIDDIAELPGFLERQSVSRAEVEVNIND